MEYGRTYRLCFWKFHYREKKKQTSNVGAREYREKFVLVIPAVCLAFNLLWNLSVFVGEEEGTSSKHIIKKEETINEGRFQMEWKRGGQEIGRNKLDKIKGRPSYKETVTLQSHRGQLNFPSHLIVLLWLSGKGRGGMSVKSRWFSWMPLGTPLPGCDNKWISAVALGQKSSQWWVSGSYHQVSHEEAVEALAKEWEYLERRVEEKVMSISCDLKTSWRCEGCSSSH